MTKGTRLQKTGKVLDPSLLNPDISSIIREISSKVVKQTKAMEELISAYARWLAGMVIPSRPIASFLFTGPTGSGKTWLCKVVSEALTGKKDALIRVDCAEYGNSHEVAKLLGSPPGYLGHRETKPRITQQMLELSKTDKCKMNFILFDEIEKAHETLRELLLGVMDNGKLHLGDNSVLDFSECIIVFTSNIGSREIQMDLSGGYGYKQDKIGETSVAISTVKKAISPEFFNRLTNIIPFHPLSVSDIQEILEIELVDLQSQIANSKLPFFFFIRDSAKDVIVKDGYDAKYGARHLKRSVEKHLINPFANMISSQQIGLGDMIAVDYEEGFVYTKEGFV